jgi:hypothetical protein
MSLFNVPYHVGTKPREIRLNGSKKRKEKLPDCRPYSVLVAEVCPFEVEREVFPMAAVPLLLVEGAEEAVLKALEVDPPELLTTALQDRMAVQDQWIRTCGHSW